MKVFISWSGELSKKVAIIFREWLPSVIQSLEPFVSSEDIEKGTRWNTDIAKELKESTFGIICVTKDNLKEPWLNFEAGALSKELENSFVAPFLLDVKPSDLKDSPISQFQATSFTTDDLNRLIKTLNTAAENSLQADNLERTFNLWYPDLKDKLSNLKPAIKETKNNNSSVIQSDILEELLEISRNTQRLLGNSDNKILNNIEQLQQIIEKSIEIDEHVNYRNDRRYSRKLEAISFEKAYLLLHDSKNDNSIFPYNVLIFLSLFKNEFPWLYDAGSEIIKVIQSNASRETKYNAIAKFNQILKITTEYSMGREPFSHNKEAIMILQKIPRILLNEMEEYNEG